MTTIENLLPADYRAASLRADALAGLTADAQWLPPKRFYDAQGSALFEKITELPEYYPTRAERSILRAVRAGDRLPHQAATRLVELGSRSSEKTRLLLVRAAVARGRCAGTCRSTSSESALTAGRAPPSPPSNPGLIVHSVVADFGETGACASRRAPTGSVTPGSSRSSGRTIGNMVPAERAVFLRRVRERLHRRRHVPARHRPGQGPGGPRPRLRRRRRGDRRVQQERPARC